MTNKDNILIYSAKVARESETFIYFPALAMQRYRPHFIGSRYNDAFDLPTDQVHIANGSGLLGRIKQALSLRLFGHNGVVFMKDKLQELNPRLLQVHFGPEATNALPLAKSLSIPLIIYYHGFDATFTREYGMKNRFLANYLRQLPTLQKEATLVFTQSNFLRDEVIKLGYPPEKVRTQYVGVTAPTNMPKPRKDRQCEVLFVARLVEKKGATYLIDAMSIVQQKYRELKLTLIGDGDDYEHLHQHAESKLKHFEFLGWQDTDNVAAAMQNALIFSVPSIVADSGDSEGFGMVFIEAQRYGTPVVSTKHGGIVESVKHETTGLLVDEKDSVALANAIIELYEDEDLWHSMSQAGYQRVKDEFNMQQLVSQQEDIYDEVLSNWSKS